MVNNIKIFSKKKNQISRNRASKNYQQYSYLFNEVNNRLFSRLNVVKRNFENTLELGSRTGNTINLFNKKKDIKKIFISDISDKMLLIAKKKQTDKQKICNQEITDILTVNGVRFTLADGSWGLVRASSNKPSLVVVTESPTSDKRKKEIFNFIDSLLQKSGKIGEYDQKI